jgi:hypothetical protein
MLNRKLLEVLVLFSKNEHKRLKLFLQSPYFNASPQAAQIFRLYEYLAQHQFLETHPALAKKRVFELFFPEKIFLEKEKGPLDSLSSELFKMVRRFLGVQLVQQETEVIEQIALAKFYHKHDLENRYWPPIEAARKELERESIQETDFYRLQYLLEEEITAFQRMNNSFEGDANLLAAHQSLDLQYLTLKMELLCALSHQRKLSNLSLDFDAGLTKFVPIVIQESTAQEVPIIQLFGYVFELIQHPGNDAVFEEFEKALVQYKSRISAEKYKNFKSYYRFFWSKRYFKSGDEASLVKMFEIYKEHFESGYFFIDDKIHFNSLRVLLVYSLKNRKFEWIKNILDGLPPERICGTRYNHEVHSLNYAEYHFYLKEYEAALEKLSYRNFENPTYGILADVLLIKIYVETGQELVEYRMKALDQKVRRSKLSAELKERYLQFLRKLAQIIKLSHLKKDPKKEKLLEEIKSIPGIVEREWLINKVMFGLEKTNA